MLEPSFVVFISLTILSTFVLVLFTMVVGRTSKRPNRGEIIPDKEQMKKFLVWKSFYSNPSDPRGWVPKTYGFGWTINFRSRRQIYLFIALILINLGSALGAVYFSGVCAK